MKRPVLALSYSLLSWRQKCMACWEQQSITSWSLPSCTVAASLAGQSGFGCLDLYHKFRRSRGGVREFLVNGIWPPLATGPCAPSEGSTCLHIGFVRYTGVFRSSNLRIIYLYLCAKATNTLEKCSSAFASKFFSFREQKTHYANTTREVMPRVHYVFLHNRPFLLG